jgi:surfeit locus 1 family protein
LALAAAMAAACVRLGIWQLDRLQQRQTINQARFDALQQTPIDLNQVPNPDSWTAFRSAIAVGEYTHEESVLLSARSYGDQTGYHLVTPFHLADSSITLLVDRGWVPFDTRQTDQLREYALTTPQRITGVLKQSQPQPEFLLGPEAVVGDPMAPRLEWRSLDIPAIAPQLSSDPAPMYLALTEPDPTEGHPPLPQPELELDAGPHLAYAIQWFAFAVIALVGVVIWLRRPSR